MVDANLTTLIGGTAVFGAIFSFWNTIKSWVIQIYGLLVVTITTYDSNFRDSSFAYFCKNYKRSKMSLDDTIMFTWSYIIPLKIRKNILATTPYNSNTITFWKGWRFINYKHTEGGKNSSNGIKISFLRLFFNKDKLLKEIEDFFNDSVKTEGNRYYVEKLLGSLGEHSSREYDKTDNAPKAVQAECGDSKFLQYLFWKNEDIGEPKKISPIDSMALNENCLNAIEEAKRWYNSVEWFKSKGIPYKRGWLMYGKPGTGKTSLVRAIAQEINIPIMVLDLSTMTNKDFTRAWTTVVSNAPCIALIEDIDSVFDGRKNLSTCNGAMTFDCLLNNIDGVQTNDGVFTIITTNNIDKIDDAIGKPNGDNISTRPGRIDRAIEMTNPDEDGRLKIAKRILDDFPNYIEKTVKDGYHDTGAQFQERCARLALKLFWENKEQKESK